jgi:hypothetical protein
MKLDIMEIVKRSWEITWKYKYLWLLGFIISLASGGSSVSNSLQSSTNNSGSTGASSSAFSNIAATYIVIIIVFALVMSLVMMVISILSIMANGGLVSAADKIEKGEKSSLKDAFKSGAHYFWRVLGQGLLIGLMIFVMVVVVIAVLGIVAVVFFAGGNQNLLAPGLACLIPLAILLITLLIAMIILLTLVSNYAMRFIVIEDAGVIDSLRRGYALFKTRWQDTAVMYLVIAVITGIGGAVLGIPGFVIALPSVFAVIGGTAAGNIGLMFLGVAGLLLAGLVGAAFGSIVSVYSSVAWTLTYLRITADK